MTALQKFTLPEPIRNELARLKAAGIHLLPLNGKAPLLRAWTGKNLTLPQILGPMSRAGSLAYGIRLDGLAVIDCDSADGDLIKTLEARFGPSPVHVQTPRGMHLYYRAGGIAPNLRGEGLPVDVKTGARAYVVGPHSQRPDGGIYLPTRGILGQEKLPALRTAKSAGPIPDGHRHIALVKEAIKMVELVDGADELQANLAALRDDWCTDPATMPDSELQGIAIWAWECRLNNRVFHGRDSAFRVDRAALDALSGNVDAIALFVLLVDQHGHVAGKRFALDFAAMRAAGLIDLTTPRLRAARRVLQGAGLLRMVSRHKAGAKCQTYALSRPHDQATNLVKLHSV